MTAPTPDPDEPAPRRSFTDLGAGLALLVIAGVAASGLGKGTQDWLFPQVLTCLLAAVGVVLILRWAVLRPRRRGAGADAEGPRGRRIDVLVMAGTIVVYALVIPLIGFWISSFLMLVGVCLFISDRRNVRSTALIVGVSAAVCVATYLIFEQIFYVPVPSFFFS